MELRDLFKQRSINAAAFAREHGIKPTTLYNILSGATGIDRVGISTFMQIAHGLDMTSDELAELLNVGKERISYAVVTLEGEEDD